MSRMIDRPEVIIRGAVMKWLDNNGYSQNTIYSNSRGFSWEQKLIRSMIFSSLYYEFNFTFADIASIFCLSESTVRRSFHGGTDFGMDPQFKDKYISLSEAIVTKYSRLKYS